MSEANKRLVSKQCEDQALANIILTVLNVVDKFCLLLEVCNTR